MTEYERLNYDSKPIDQFHKVNYLQNLLSKLHSPSIKTRISLVAIIYPQIAKIFIGNYHSVKWIRNITAPSLFTH